MIDGSVIQEIIKFLEDPTAAPVTKPKETSWAEEPSDVIHLTDSSFDEFLLNEPSALIMFYAPWCGHCKRAKPHFVSASARYI